MTESQLLANDDFLAWCRAWEEDRRCPFAMADWCLENVSELAFHACEWAYWTVERRRLAKTSRVYPYNDGEDSYWQWGAIHRLPINFYASDVPIFHYRNTHATFAAAIACYITQFDREEAKKYPFTRELATV